MRILRLHCTYACLLQMSQDKMVFLQLMHLPPTQRQQLVTVLMQEHVIGNTTSMYTHYYEYA